MITVRTSQGEDTLSIEEFEASVREGRIEPTAPVRFELLTRDRWVEARELELFQRLYSPGQIHFTRAFSLGRFPRVTAILCVVLVALYLWSGGFQGSVPLDALVQAGAKWQPLIFELGQTWRLVVANLLHRDGLHLLFNVLFLFNVGGTIENAYRLSGYVFIIVVSAVFTSGASALLSDLPSVGASGVVLGLFGSASVFGYRYGALLPRRYRRYFGGAVLPCAAFILALGFVTRDTDNWGHVGGFLGGIVATLPLRPALLHERGAREKWFVSRGGFGWAAVLVIGAVALAGPVLRAWGPPYRTFEDAGRGIQWAYPAGWASRTDHLGLPAFANALGASIGVRAERTLDGPVSLNDLSRHFRETLLASRLAEGEVAQVRLGSGRPFLIEGATGLELPIELESRAGPLVTRNLLIARGAYRYFVVVAVPRVWVSAYEPIVNALLDRVVLTEPTPLSTARARVFVFPAMSSVLVEFGDALSSIGRVGEAAGAYQRALSSFPDQIDALYGLCRLALEHGGDLASAERVASDLVARRPADARYARVLADLRWRLGQTDGACAVIHEALDRVQEPPEDLRLRLTEFGCRTAVGLRP